MARKGIVFSVDMVIATAVLILAIATLTFVHHATTTQTAKFQSMNAAARDTIKILSETTIGEASVIPLVQEYIDNGTINSTDLNKTLLDAIGSFWAANEGDKAAALTDAVVSPYLPDSLHYSVYVDDSLITTNGRNYSSAVAAASVVSGYKVGEPISGYIARAWTTKVVGRESQIIDISPLGSGFGNTYGRGGNLTIVKPVEIPANATNISAELFLSLHEESGWVFVFVNGVLQDIPSGNDCYHPVGQCYDKIEIHNLTAGLNLVHLELERPATYHSHTHPGTVLVVDYFNEKESSYYKEKEVYEELNLTHVTGSPCVWQTFPFHIPKNSELNSATLYLHVEGLDDFLTVHVNQYAVHIDHSPSSTEDLQIDILRELHQTLNYTPELRYHDNGYNSYHRIEPSRNRSVAFRQDDLPADPDAYTLSFYIRRRNNPGNLYVYLETELNMSQSNLIANYSPSEIQTSYGWHTINLTEGNFTNTSADHYLVFRCAYDCTDGWWGNNYRIGRDTNSAGDSSYYTSSGAWYQTSSDYMATLFFNTTPISDTNVSTGETNTVAVYADIGALSDTYMSGASGSATINGSSYLELNYTLPEAVSHYGAIPYNVIEEFGGVSALTKQINFNITDLPLYKAYFHPVQKYSYRVAAAAWHDPESTPTWSGNNWNPTSRQIFRSPNSRNVPASIFIPIDRIEKGKLNHVIARDFAGSSNDHLLPNSTIDYTIFVPSQVPYGAVFPTLGNASDDAEDRLNATFTQYNITGNFTIDTANIAGIKTLWGPSRIKVVIGS